MMANDYKVLLLHKVDGCSLFVILCDSFGRCVTECQRAIDQYADAADGNCRGSRPRVRLRDNHYSNYTDQNRSSSDPHVTTQKSGLGHRTAQRDACGGKTFREHIDICYGTHLEDYATTVDR